MCFLGRIASAAAFIGSLVWVSVPNAGLYITATGSHLLKLLLLLSVSSKTFCIFFSSSMHTVTFPMQVPAFTRKTLLKHFHIDLSLLWSPLTCFYPASIAVIHIQNAENMENSNCR